MLPKGRAVISPPPQLIITSEPLFRVGGSLSGTDNRRTMDSRGTNAPYKYTGAEGSQIGYFNIYPNAPRSKVNSHTNGQYCRSVIYSQNGGNPQQSLIGHKQRDWDFLLLKEITITVEYLPGFLNQEASFQSRSMKDSSKWKLKPQIFQALCNLRGTPDIDLFAS